MSMNGGLSCVLCGIASRSSSSSLLQPEVNLGPPGEARCSLGSVQERPRPGVSDEKRTCVLQAYKMTDTKHRFGSSVGFLGFTTTTSFFS